MFPRVAYSSSPSLARFLDLCSRNVLLFLTGDSRLLSHYSYREIKFSQNLSKNCSISHPTKFIIWKRTISTTTLQSFKMNKIHPQPESHIESDNEKNVNSKIIHPPLAVRGMKKLDYDLFRKEIEIPYVQLQIGNIDNVKKQLKNFLLKMPSFRPVIPLPEDSNILQIFLNPDAFNEDARKKIEQITSCLLPTNESETKFVSYRKQELTYENFNYHTIFRAILPEDVDSISGFSTIGHIIHLNLREEALPYKQLIGQVLLDKVKGCRLVINKLDIIDTKFRNFAMEILAKDDSDPPVDTVVSTTESDIRYKFDFAKVYWNPRLSAERTRISEKLLREVDVLYDVFAGVGPFALYAAKFMKCRVLANDLNPESYRWLCENVRINKVDKLVTCYNGDGRHFIRTQLKNDLIQYARNYDGSNCNRRYHVVMNLPEIAVEFLDAFNGLLSDYDESYAAGDNHTQSIHKIEFLNIHCYCFVKNVPEEEVKDYVIQLASSKLGHQIVPNQIDEIFDVRKVAPKKNMYRISFRLAQDILYGTRKSDGDYAQQQAEDEISLCKRHKND